MPHHAQPFFRTGRGWYVQLGKRQIKLADGPENADTSAAAWRRYHEVMTEQAKTSALAPNNSSGLTVAEVFDKFLDWCRRHREPRTTEWYHDHLQSFLNHAGAIALEPATALKPFTVVEWADAHADWSPAYRRGAIVAIQRPFNWAAKIGHLEASPIRTIEKPEAQRRESYIRPDTWRKIRDHYAAADPFRDIITFCWETGCRPQEAKRIEARHVDLRGQCVVFPKEEAKGKRRPRIIHLTDEAAFIVSRLVRKHPHGVLFRNEDGHAWTAQAMACRFTRLKKHLGIKFACYDLRHGFANRLLTNRADSLTVAKIMGHADTRMLSKHYAHLDDEADYLREQLKRAGGDSAA